MMHYVIAVVISRYGLLDYGSKVYNLQKTMLFKRITSITYKLQNKLDAIMANPLNFSFGRVRVNFSQKNSNKWARFP